MDNKMGMDHSTLLNELIRSDNTPSTTYNNSNSRVFDERKEQLRTIVNSLRESSSTYQPEATIDLITKYNGSGTRILYSEVTNAVYGMTPEERGTVATNLDKLIEYAFDESQQLHDDVKDAATRLWDHFNLAFRQVDNVKHTYGEAKEEVERELYQKSKDMEKEYVAIFGIFASIVLTFTAGIAFSTSVLENIHNGSPYRVTLACLLIGLVLFNILYCLYHFIERIIRKPERSPQRPEKSFVRTHTIFITVNIVLLVLIGGTVWFWGKGMVESRNQRVNRASNDEMSSYSINVDVPKKITLFNGIEI